MWRLCWPRSSSPVQRQCFVISRDVAQGWRVALWTVLGMTLLCRWNGSPWPFYWPSLCALSGCFTASMINQVLAG